MDKKTVQHIAKLSHLHINDVEIVAFEKELSSILEYVSALNSVDTQGAEATGRQGDCVNVFREDVASAIDAELSAALINSAPDAQEGYVKVKAIF